MTEQELCDQKGIALCYFDATGWHSSGFYNPTLKIIGLDHNLTKPERYKILLHELGHIEHQPYSYRLFPQKHEIQADRNMIHHLVKEAISDLDNKSEFNYLQFMEYYNLKTITDEAMVKEEYLSLIS